jgi:hypothetical protein
LSSNPGLSRRGLLQALFSETLVYAVVVFTYFWCVLHFLGPWLNDLFLHRRTWYAMMAVALIAFQGVGLEFLTRMLLRFFRRPSGR